MRDVASGPFVNFSLLSKLFPSLRRLVELDITNGSSMCPLKSQMPFPHGLKNISNQLIACKIPRFLIKNSGKNGLEQLG